MHARAQVEVGDVQPGIGHHAFLIVIGYRQAHVVVIAARRHGHVVGAQHAHAHKVAEVVGAPRRPGCALAHAAHHRRVVLR
nr:hypothetical protein [Tanacetum cinerariifolium]